MPQLFLVRIWVEATVGQPGRWRGVVEHLPDGTRQHFVTLDALCHFITAQLENLALAPYSQNPPPDSADDESARST